MKPLSLLKQGLLVTWTAWFSLAFLTNTCDFLKQFNLLPVTWNFVSGNFAMVSTSLARYPLPLFLPVLLFIFILMMEGFASICFWNSLLHFKKRPSKAMPWINLAFTSGILIWGIFLVMDEIFIAYPFEQVHLLLFIAQLFSLMAIHQLQD